MSSQGGRAGLLKKDELEDGAFLQARSISAFGKRTLRAAREWAVKERPVCLGV